MDEEERQHVQELLNIYRRRFNVLQKQAARYGARTPADILLELEDLQAQIDTQSARLGLPASSAPVGITTLHGPATTEEEAIHKRAHSFIFSSFAFQWLALALVSIALTFLVLALVATLYGYPPSDISDFNHVVFTNVQVAPILLGLIISSVQWLALKRYNVKLIYWATGNVVIWGIMSLAARDVFIPLLSNLLLGVLLRWQAASQS